MLWPNYLENNPMNQTQINFQKILTAALIGALISVAALYIQSTIPKLLQKQ